MQYNKKIPGLRARGNLLLAGVLAGSMILSTPAPAQDKHAPAQLPAAAKIQKTSPYHLASVPRRGQEYIQSAWGVNNLLVHITASGNLIRFSYRVTDPVRAKGLGDSHATPLMFGQRSHALLHIPVMDKIGQLRQTGVPVAGQEYWMVFSNKGNLVRSGDRVNVLIGSFHADGLMVE